MSLSTVQAHALGLNDVTFNDNLAAAWHLVLGDYSGISFPIVFKQEYGKKLHDILNTGWPSLHLISDKMKVVLEENTLTGWKTYAVKVLDKRGQQITGYHGFSVTGRCGKIDHDQSEIIEKQFVPNGPVVKLYKGMHVDMNNWDGGDFFFPEKYFSIITTQRAAEVLKKNKLTNIRLENLAEIEVDYDMVQNSLQNHA